MNARSESPRTVRIVSSLLALVWIAAGFASIVIAVIGSRWLTGLIGLTAIGYGLLWVRVMRLGRRLTVREAFMPWRLGRRSGPK
jgi:hypothetical protein